MSLLGTVIFWFVIIAASLSLCQLILQLAWKRWRFQWLYGLLDAPRLQFTLLSLSMAAVAWASVLVIRGEGGAAAHIPAHPRSAHAPHACASRPAEQVAPRSYAVCQWIQKTHGNS